MIYIIAAVVVLVLLGVLPMAQKLIWRALRFVVGAIFTVIILLFLIQYFTN